MGDLAVSIAHSSRAIARCDIRTCKYDPGDDRVAEEAYRSPGDAESREGCARRLPPKKGAASTPGRRGSIPPVSSKTPTGRNDGKYYGDPFCHLSVEIIIAQQSFCDQIGTQQGQRRVQSDAARLGEVGIRILRDAHYCDEADHEPIAKGPAPPPPRIEENENGDGPNGIVGESEMADQARPSIRLGKQQQNGYEYV